MDQGRQSERPLRRRTLSSSNSGSSQLDLQGSKMPTGSAVFSDDDVSAMVTPPVRAQYGPRSRSSHGTRPFASAGHEPGELPRQNRSANARLIGGGMAPEDSSDDMFQNFLDCFSRPISQSGMRSRNQKTQAATASIASSRDAVKSMASSLAAAERSRSALATRARRAPSRGSDSPSSQLLSQFLGSQRSLPNLGSQASQASVVATAEFGTERGASASSGSEEELPADGMRADWDWERAARDHLPQKVLHLEQNQVSQDGKMEVLRRENLLMKRESVANRAVKANLENEIGRLSQQIAQMAQAQINKEAELKEALGDQIRENETGRARGGLAKGKSDAEFQRLKGMYATTTELKTKFGAPKPASTPGSYDPWAADSVTTFEARDSMAEALMSVKSFVSDVEKEQFCTRQLREQAYHFAHSLDLKRLAGQVDEWETQRANGDWKMLPAHARQLITKAKEAKKTRLAVDMEKDDGRSVRYNLDLEKMTAVRDRERNIRSRERSDLERAAGVLAAVASVRTKNPSTAEAMVEAQRLSQLWSDIDDDHSGSLDAAEVRKLMEKMNKPMSDDEFADFMKGVDGDGSGVVGYDEFLEWWQNYDSDLLNLKEGSASAVFEVIKGKLETGCVPLDDGIFQFVVHGADGQPQYFAIDTTTPPGSIFSGSRHPKAGTQYEMTESELASLIQQLSRPSQTGVVRAMVNGQEIRVAVPEPAAKGKKGKAKGKKGKKADITDARMVWEERLEDGEWRSMPESVSEHMDALRLAGGDLSGTAKISLGAGITIDVDLQNMKILNKTKTMRVDATDDDRPKGIEIGTQFGPDQWPKAEPTEAELAKAAGGKKGKKDKGPKVVWYHGKVPTAWVETLLNSKPPKSGLSEKQLCQIIWDIYNAKIEADRADDTAGSTRDEMDEFIFEFFLHKFGLYTLAIKHMVILVFTLISDVGIEIPMVSLFRRLCFLEFKEPEKNLPRDSLDLILAVLANTSAVAGAGDSFPDCDVAEKFVPLGKMRTGLKVALHKACSMEDLNTHISTILDNHVTMKTSGHPRRDIDCCSLDEAMLTAAEIALDARIKREQPIIDAFAAADDGDGVMTYAEFEDAVKALIPDVAHSEMVVIRMFRDALQSSHGLKPGRSPNALTPKAFANAILRYQGFAARAQ